MKFAHQILNYRQANHMPQAELARLLKVTVQTVSNWETGRCEPKGAQSILDRLPTLLHTPLSLCDRVLADVGAP